MHKVLRREYCSTICMSVLCLLDITTSCDKTAETIDMPFGVWTRTGPRNYVFGVPRHPLGNGHF